jgi:hypothetical protein
LKSWLDADVSEVWRISGPERFEIVEFWTLGFPTLLCRMVGIEPAVGTSPCPEAASWNKISRIKSQS